MGKRPKDDFKWLEDELLALEKKEEPKEDSVDDVLQWWQEEEEGRNPGWNVGIYEDDPVFDEDAAVLAMSPKEKRRLELAQRRQHQEEKQAREKKKQKKKQKGIGGLVVLALAEIAGIFALIWWWIQWLT